MKKNIFDNYGDNILLRPNRSHTEIEFEKWAEECDEIEWIYKNGDKGDDFFSIVYQKGFARANFYPDYIIKLKNGKKWIIEAKGGANTDGDDLNIDVYAKNKFESLKDYSIRKNIDFGFVRAYGSHLYCSNIIWDDNINNHNVWIDIDLIIK